MPKPPPRIDALCGVLVVDKPPRLTSFAVVKAVRRALGVRKAGHTGTLDPMATGVLPICLGEATKIAQYLLADDKTYEGEAELGIETDTLDITGAEVRRTSPAEVDAAALERAIATFSGEIAQVPPAFSAIHVNGQRAYDLARRGEAVALDARTVRVDRFRLTAFAAPRFTFEVACSKGTYVRSLVRDVGAALGCGATLTALRRTRSGAFDLTRAIALDALGGDSEPPIVAMNDALAHLPGMRLSADEAQRIASGQPVDGGGGFGAGPVRLFTDARLVALGEAKADKLWPRRVFAEAGS